MILVIQRVTQASVTVHQHIIGSIENGMMVLFCAEKTDDVNSVLPLVQKLTRLRIFNDTQDKMNLSMIDLPHHQLLLIPQFTLAADCRKGNRPNFMAAANPKTGEHLFNRFKNECEIALNRPVITGQFGAHMNIQLCNSGPATFILQTQKALL